MSSFVISKQEYIKAGGFFAGLADQRITPACAGKRPAGAFFSRSAGDHPRLCGEKPENMRFSAIFRGSPPLVRGKEHSNATAFMFTRITPACAGKRSVLLVVLFVCKDHPRLCGEKRQPKQKPRAVRGSPPLVRGKAFFCIGHRAAQGSPPLVRGKGTARNQENCRPGITPACAGKRQP